MTQSEAHTITGLFAYGTLKKDEIAFNQIEHLVESVKEVELSNFEIGIRDGLPVVFESQGSTVEGQLIIPIATTVDKFWKTVEDYEGTYLYRKVQVSVVEGSGEKISCTTFVGKREKARGYSKLESQSWTSNQDPYLAYSLPILLDAIKGVAKESYPADMRGEYWRYMNQLQEKYLLLTVILEHVALLVIGAPNSTGPNARIKQLGETEEWAQAFQKVQSSAGITKIQVKDSKKLRYIYGNESPQEAISTYYQVRSNLSHQGKSGGFADCELMYACLIDLSSILKEYLIIKIAGIENQWKLVQRHKS